MKTTKKQENKRQTSQGHRETKETLKYFVNNQQEKRQKLQRNVTYQYSQVEFWRICPLKIVGDIPHS